MELWLTRLALLWVDGSVLLLAALVSVGPYALAVGGAGALVGRPRWPLRRQTGRTTPSSAAPRFTLR